jgi:hypothetical protein
MGSGARRRQGATSPDIIVDDNIDGEFLDKGKEESLQVTATAWGQVIEASLHCAT